MSGPLAMRCSGRRSCRRPIAILLGAAFAVLAGFGASAAPVEGKDFTAISPAQPTSDPARIVVTEFFSYQCPHCYALAAPFSAWSNTMPKDVKVERVAVSIGHASWVPMAQAFYALAAMKAVPDLDEALFQAIHRQRARLTDESGIAEWLSRHGIERSEFLKTYRSFGVQLRTKRADEQSRSHRIPGVPVLVVDGRFMVAMVDDGDFNDQLRVVGSLIDRVRRERAGGSLAGT